MLIHILEDDEPFDWQPVHEESGQQYDSVFQLRIVTDEADKEFRKKHTKPVFDKKQRRMVDKLDEAAFVDDLLNAAIVGWTGVQGAKSGQDVACTPEMKRRLPEKWKAEILRLCAGKEGGEMLAATEEKKHSPSISGGKPTA